MTQTLEQLREDARSLGLRVHHKHSEETLREMIDDALADKKQEQETTPAQIAEPQVLPPVNIKPVAQQQNKPVRVLMYKHTGEKLWVMQENIQQYLNQGWMLV